MGTPEPAPDEDPNEPIEVADLGMGDITDDDE